MKTKKKKKKKREEFVFFLLGGVNILSFLATHFPFHRSPPSHLVSESVSRQARVYAGVSLVSSTQSLTISTNMVGQSLCSASLFKPVLDAVCTSPRRY